MTQIPLDCVIALCVFPRKRSVYQGSFWNITAHTAEKVLTSRWLIVVCGLISEFSPAHDLGFIRFLISVKVWAKHLGAFQSP